MVGHHFQRLSENKIILGPHINQKLFVGREVVSLSCTSYLGEQWWCSGQSTRLPPMWPGYESWRRHHMWLEFVVGSLFCCKSFFFWVLRFSPLLKKNLPNSNSIWNTQTHFNEFLRTPKCSFGKLITRGEQFGSNWVIWNNEPEYLWIVRHIGLLQRTNLLCQ